MSKKLVYIFFIFYFNVALANSTKIVAIVNDNSITSYDLETRKNTTLKLNNIDSNDTNILRNLTRVCLESLITQEILFQHAKTANITISENDIDEAMETIATRNKLSKVALLDSLRAKGVQIKDFRTQIKSELIQMEIISNLNRAIQVYSSEVDDIILNNSNKEVSIEGYLISSHSKTQEDLNKMYKLHKSIQTNTICNKIANMNFHFADKTIITGHLSSLPNNLQIIVKDMGVNSVSSILDNGDVLQMIVLCKKSIEEMTDKESKYIINLLNNQKTSQKTQKFLEDLRKKAYIKVMLD